MTIQKNRKNMKKLAGSLGILFVILGVGIGYVRRPAAGLDEFARLTQEDPLFYSPFLDGEAFNSAVESLEVSERALKKTTLEKLGTRSEPYAASYMKLIRSHSLFPTDFLGQLPALARATEEFTARPTARKARLLLDRYKKAQNTYEAQAASMVNAFDAIDEHVPDNYPLYYFFTDSAISLSVAGYDFVLIYQNSIALGKEIENRSACLSGQGSCAQRQSAALDSSITSRIEPITTKGSNAEFVRDTLPFKDTDRKVTGPYSVTSACWGGSRTQQSMYGIYSARNGKTSLLPKLTEQNYYRMVPSNATDAIGKAIITKGLSFYNQPEATTYECSDLTFYPEILALDFMNTYIESGRATPETIASSPEIAKLWQNQFGLLAPALQSLADYTNLLETSQRAGDDYVLSPQFLFMTRSAYSLTYLPFAHSVWRIDEDPTYMITREEYERLGAPQPFKTLTELQKSGFSEAAIRTSHINQRELIDSLIK
jgi:hypothetical protein